MTDRYLPESEFLNYVFAEEVLFDDSPIGQANLLHLLSLVKDEDRSIAIGRPSLSPGCRSTLRQFAQH